MEQIILVRVFFRNILLYLFILTSVPIFASVIILLGIFDRRRRFIPYISRFWLRLVVLISGVYLKVEGTENISPNGIYIFAANHQSQFDIPALELAIPFPICWLAKKSLFKIPFFGWALGVIGCIPVERKDPREGLKSLIAASEKIREGNSIVIFPEGTRSLDGKLLPFKSGGFIIAIKTSCPVVPVAIKGTREILPKGSLWVRPGVVSIRIMPPIHTNGLSLRDKRYLADIVRQKIEEALYSPSMYL